MDAHVEDVDVLVAEDAGELVELPRTVVEPGAEGEVASGAREALLDDLAQKVRIDVPAADDDADAFPGKVARAVEQRGDARRARGLGEELAPLEQQHHRAREGLVAADAHRDAVGPRDLERALRGAPDRQAGPERPAAGGTG